MRETVRTLVCSVAAQSDVVKTIGKSTGGRWRGLRDTAPLRVGSHGCQDVDEQEEADAGLGQFGRE
jgi:hypothetical protein